MLDLVAALVAYLRHDTPKAIPDIFVTPMAVIYF